MRDSQRLDWLNRTRCQIDCCSLIPCSIGEIPHRPDYHYQSAELKQTKKLFPEYKGIYFEVQQNNFRRLDESWQPCLVPDKTGKKIARPRFKKSGNLRSLTS